jgi:hypothetical protein
MIFNIGLGGILVIVVVLVICSFRILREYERTVVFMLGRFGEVKGPWLILIIPGVQQMVRVDLCIAGAMQLRYRQTLTEIAGEKSSTIVFPLPVDILSALTGAIARQKPYGA